MHTDFNQLCKIYVKYLYCTDASWGSRADLAACVVAAVIRSTAWPQGSQGVPGWLHGICINIAHTCPARTEPNRWDAFRPASHRTAPPRLPRPLLHATCYDILIIYLDKRVASVESSAVQLGAVPCGAVRCGRAWMRFGIRTSPEWPMQIVCFGRKPLELLSNK